MLHIILVILKIIGIVLAFVLSLLLLILLVALFVPVRYRIRAKREGNEIYGEGKVSYLLHILTVVVEYKDGKPDFKIRILGIPLKGKKSKKLKKVKTKKSRTKEETKLLETVPDDKIISEEVEQEIINAMEETNSLESASETKFTQKIEGVVVATGVDEIKDVNEPEDVDVPLDEKTKKISIFQKIKDYLLTFLKFLKGIPGIFTKISDAWKKIKFVFKNIKGQFTKYWGILRAEESKALFRSSKKELWYLLKHFRPREAKGYIRFGTGDPATTGQILGISCIFLPIYSSKIQVYPDFENSIYEGSIQIKGHIRACHLLKSGWKIYRDKNLKKFLKRIKE